MFFPRPEFPKFYGNLLEFKCFNNFKTHIDPRVNDERTLFCLLLRHCSDNIQDQVNHLAGNKAYHQQAKQKGSTNHLGLYLMLDTKKFPKFLSRLNHFCHCTKDWEEMFWSNVARIDWQETVLEPDASRYVKFGQSQSPDLFFSLSSEKGVDFQFVQISLSFFSKLQ